MTPGLADFSRTAIRGEYGGGVKWRRDPFPMNFPGFFRAGPGAGQDPDRLICPDFFAVTPSRGGAPGARLITKATGSVDLEDVVRPPDRGVGRAAAEGSEGV